MSDNSTNLTEKLATQETQDLNETKLKDAGEKADEIQSESETSSTLLSLRSFIVWGVVALVVILTVGGFALWSRSGNAAKEDKASAEKKDEHGGEHGDEHGGEVALSPEALEAAGIEIEGVTQRPAIALLKVTGTVEVNQQQIQQVTPLVGGRVERVYVAQGDRVKAGAILATISSPEIAEMHGKLRESETRLQLAERKFERVQKAENRVGVLQAKARLDEAEATLKRVNRLVELGAGAGKDLIAAETAYKTAKAEYDFQSNISLNREVQEAQAEVASAQVDAAHLRQSLQALGVIVGAEDKHTRNISLVDLYAPASGIITERMVNAGTGIQAGATLFTISNISTVWAIANVPENQIHLLSAGTPAEIRAAAIGPEAINGRVSYIDPRLSEETRTARVRVEVANPGERLKTGMFVEIGFQAGTGANMSEELVVPSSAVQRIGEKNVVFIPKDDEPGAFEVREIEIGGEVEGYTRIVNGLKLGDKVVTKGSFTLKTQSQKGAMGGHDH
jgi:cobalt-zinc-cadmium efflux system membrane fusion protein